MRRIITVHAHSEESTLQHTSTNTSRGARAPRLAGSGHFHIPTSHHTNNETTLNSLLFSSCPRILPIHANAFRCYRPQMAPVEAEQFFIFLYFCCSEHPFEEISSLLFAVTIDQKYSASSYRCPTTIAVPPFASTDSP
jgi:hypothetical protein